MLHKIVDKQFQRREDNKTKIGRKNTKMLFSLQSQDMGIEHLSIEFPPSSYKGHFAEDGYNGVFFTSASHCFAHNLRIVNAGRSCQKSQFFGH